MAVEYFGLPDEYMEGADKIWETYIHPDDRAVYQEDIRAVFSGEKKYHNMEYRARNKEGNYVICTCRGIILRGENGEPDLFAGTILNHGIVDRVDATTNLYNIYEFLHTVRQLSQMKEAALVMMVGLNQFRTINNTYGYVFGNQVLKTFASMLMELVRGRGMVYRMDGAKFALCVRQMDMDEAKELYARIQDLARNSVIVDNTHILLSVSGGAVLVDNSNAGEYSIRASVAYAQDKSKRECHSSLVFFDNEQESSKLRSLELFETIRQCVLRGCKGFFMCYQPLVRAQDGRIVGMEALLRWKQEPYGELLPGAFIQWLERDDCIFELGNWILRQSMIDGLEILKQRPDFVVNVNVSYTQLDRSEFRDSLMEILRETGFPPQNLYIELTERCQTMDLEQLRENLNFFCSCGIRIALDDFGTGTASMNLLRELPISCVKIDRAFVSNIQTNHTDEIIVEMVIDSANKLGMSVCMEGVENKELRDYLLKYNVSTHQGYYYSRPVRIEKFMELLDAEK
jgi:diguanylate cyclase (GGDEF)-like protein/PAS domain S-box-containing protein